MIEIKELRKGNRKNTYLLDNMLDGLISIDEVRKKLGYTRATIMHKVNYLDIPKFIWGSHTYIEKSNVEKLGRNWRDYMSWNQKEENENKLIEYGAISKKRYPEIANMVEVKRYKILESDYFRWVGITDIMEFIPIKECIYWLNIEKIRAKINKGEIEVYRRQDVASR